MSTDRAPGVVLAERYRLARLLGEGGMGIVWAAVDTVTDKPVALKLLRPDSIDDISVRRRFLREARAAAAIHHPDVLAIRDVIELPDGTPVLVMDLLEGESLRDKLLREHRIPLPELSNILLPVISAVGTAHALGIIHRDLKPDNIFLLAPSAPGTAAGAPGRPPAPSIPLPSGGRAGSAPHLKAGGAAPAPVRVKVLDFGIAKLTAVEGEAARTEGITDTGALLGTPYYMSPEQILGEHDIDHRADIWSLGIILYECLTSVRPTEADSFGKVLKRVLTGSTLPVREIAPDLPADVGAMVDRMLSAERSLRPADLAEVGKVLERYASVTLRPFGPPAAPRRDSFAGAPAPLPSMPRARPSADAGLDALNRAPELATLDATGGRPSDILSGRPSSPATLRSSGVLPLPRELPEERADKPEAASTTDVHALDDLPPSTAFKAVLVSALVLAATVALFGFLRRTDAPSASALPPAPQTSATAAPSCPEGMVLIRGGTFHMGAAQGAQDEQPVHPVVVRDFCLDRLEVTVADFSACVLAKQCGPRAATVLRQGITRNAQELESRLCTPHKEDLGHHPINCVSFHDAEGFCRARGKRLPTEQEWEYAASAGGAQRPFVWGGSPPGPALLNACAAECVGGKPPRGKGHKPLYSAADPFPITAPGGRFPAGASATGVQDLAGNVSEWTASAYCQYPNHGCSSPYRVFRGSAWTSTLIEDLHSTHRYWGSPDHRYADVGFRCAVDTGSSTHGP